MSPARSSRAASRRHPAFELPSPAHSLLLVEANHPKDVGYIDYGVVYGGRAPSFPEVRVRAEWGINQPRFDLVTGRVDTQIRITVERRGDSTARVVASTEKLWFPRELALLVERSPLAILDHFGGYKPGRITWDDALQVIALGRRA